MAGEEMNTIKDLDIPLLEKLGDKLYFFFATEDNWVGANKEVIVKALSGEAHSIRIVHGRHGIPHAYCISKLSGSIKLTKILITMQLYKTIAWN